MVMDQCLNQALFSFFHICIILGFVQSLYSAEASTVQNENYGFLKQYRDGDVIIAAALPISRRDAFGVCTEDLAQDSIIFVETINMVVDQINRNDDILGGVKIGTVMIDTCQSDAHAVQRVIMDILPLALNEDYCQVNCSDMPRKPILAGVVGAVSSSVSIPIAKLLQVFSIPQISHWSTNPDLSDKTRFKYFFRTVPPDTYQVDAIISLLNKRKWNYVSVVYDDDAYGTSGYQELEKKTKLHDICIAYDRSLPVYPLSEDLTEVVEELMKNKKSNAVIVFTDGTNAEKLISTAHKVPGALNSLVWIGSDGWTAYLPADIDDDSYLESLDGSVGFLPKFSQLDGVFDYFTNITLIQNQGSNYSRNPWFEKFISRRNNCSLLKDSISSGVRPCSPDEHIDPSTFIYGNNSIGEAVLAFVHALDAYHRNICNNQSGLCEAMSSKAGTNKVACDVYHYLKNVTFKGGGGRIFEFDENQDGPPIYDAFMYKRKIMKYRRRFKSDWVHVGTYEDEENWEITLHEKMLSTRSVCSLPCEHGQEKILATETCCWYCHTCLGREYVSPNETCSECPEGEKPNTFKDGCVRMKIQEMEYDSGYVILPLVLGIVGLIGTIVITGAFIKFRDTAIVRASGKELCFFVLFGIFLTLLNCFSVTSRATTLSCVISGIILSIGPTCMYAGLLMKTIRVAFIFQSKGIMTTRTKVYLQPIPLIVVTSSVAFVQVIFLAVWIIIDVPEPTEIYMDEDNLFLSCSNMISIEILIGLLYPFLLIIVCTVIATINRNVPTGFKESLYVGFTMYTTLIIWLTFLPIFLTNWTDIPKKLTTVSVALSLSAITVLFCLFVPRCYIILFHPESNTSETVMSIKRTRHDSLRSIRKLSSRTTDTCKCSSSDTVCRQHERRKTEVYHTAVQKFNDNLNVET